MSLHPVARCFLHSRGSLLSGSSALLRNVTLQPLDNATRFTGTRLFASLGNTKLEKSKGSHFAEKRNYLNSPSKLLDFSLASGIKREYHLGASGSILGCLSPLTVRIPSTSGLNLGPTPLLNTIRSVTKFSRLKGRRKTSCAVKKRFYRLDWGGWISARPGRYTHLWKKHGQRKHRLRYHVFRNAKECTQLDRMVTKYWVKKKYFVDDPYESYHTRDNFHITKGVKGIISTELQSTKQPLPRAQRLFSLYKKGEEYLISRWKKDKKNPR